MTQTNHVVWLWSTIIASVIGAGCAGSGCEKEERVRPSTRWPAGATMLGENLELVEVVAAGDQFIAVDSSGALWSVPRSGGSPSLRGRVGDSGILDQMVVAGDQVVVLLYCYGARLMMENASA